MWGIGLQYVKTGSNVRLKEIHSGAAELRNATQWKRAILLNKKQAKLACNNEQFAVRWLGRENFP